MRRRKPCAKAGPALARSPHVAADVRRRSPRSEIRQSRPSHRAWLSPSANRPVDPAAPVTVDADHPSNPGIPLGGPLKRKSEKFSRGGKVAEPATAERVRDTDARRAAVADTQSDAGDTLSDRADTRRDRGDTRSDRADIASGGADTRSDGLCRAVRSSRSTVSANRFVVRANRIAVRVNRAAFSENSDDVSSIRAALSGNSVDVTGARERVDDRTEGGGGKREAVNGKGPDERARIGSHGRERREWRWKRFGQISFLCVFAPCSGSLRARSCRPSGSEVTTLIARSKERNGHKEARKDTKMDGACGGRQMTDDGGPVTERVRAR